MLHSSKSFVFRKFVELKAPAEIQRAYSAYSNIVPAAIESLDHEGAKKKAIKFCFLDFAPLLLSSNIRG